MKIEFEKTFGQGVDPWYDKAERWVKKKFKNPFVQHLALGLIEWLKIKWIDVKVANTMRDIDAQAENIQAIWDDEEESNKRMDVIGQNGNLGIHYDETPSEVDGLNDMEIKRKW